jgi:hypothetical protein
MKTKLYNGSLLIQPTALIPLLMSFAALTLVISHALIFGIVHETDEGTLAHLFQLLMIAQLPIIVYFLIKWFQKNPKQTIIVIVMQAIMWLAAIAAVFWLT